MQAGIFLQKKNIKNLKFRETAMMNNHRNVKYVADAFLHANPKNNL